MENRKLITIVTEAAIEKLLVKDLKRLGAHGYTIVEARGEGSHGTRTGDWDLTTNIRIEVVCDQGTVDTIVQHLMATYSPHYATVVYVSDVQIVRPEKF